MLAYDPKLRPLARTLRKNTTDAERKLWACVSRRQFMGYMFTRQKTIGNYIVDFYCQRARLVIEVDGGQHCSDAGLMKAVVRDKYLSERGLKVLRFSNHDILTNIVGVVHVILEHLSANDLENPLNPPRIKYGAGSLEKGETP